MIYLVVPKLVYQSTWGGAYIPKLKQIELKPQEKIGQSYEFFKLSKVVPAKNLKKLKITKYPYCTGTNDFKDAKLHNKVAGITEITKLNPNEIFGSKNIPNILIKLTQALGNSYQIHVKYPTTKFKPKAESWYYFEKGKATLGLKPDVDLKSYKHTCQKIYELAQSLGKKIKAKKMKHADAEKELFRFIEANNPQQYVNLLDIPQGGIIENTYGGIHHSWEEDPRKYPNGNILYEVQEDVPDDVSTVRCFDQGKIGPYGTVRKLDIDTYFQNLTTNKSFNDSKNLLKTRIKMKDLKDWKLNKIFKNNIYEMDELTVTRKQYEIEDFGFRHIFIKSGRGMIVTEDEEVELVSGYSYLIPHSLKQLKIVNLSQKISGEREKFVILLTYPARR